LEGQAASHSFFFASFPPKKKEEPIWFEDKTKTRSLPSQTSKAFQIKTRVATDSHVPQNPEPCPGL